MDPNESFSQKDVFKDLLEEFITFLNDTDLKDSEEKTLEFESLIGQHLASAAPGRSLLPSVGKEVMWLNTSRPLSLEEDLSNRIVVMDFFTYCCINCHHTLPILKEVETTYKNNEGLVLISVHCAKFTNEKNLKQVEDAILRYKITHPVINDPECKLWTLFNIKCWPTVFIVGPGRNLLFVLIGERQIEKLPFIIKYVIDFFEGMGSRLCEAGRLDQHPLPICELRKTEEDRSSNMQFPESISYNGKYIVISHTGNHQLLLMTRDFEVKEVIGNGDSGFNDGPLDTASFNSPHGTQWHENELYIADTGNHSIRKVCFTTRLVSTVFNGKECLKFRSPWDLCIGHQLGSPEKLHVLYISVAGSHQIWSLDLNEQRVNALEFCTPFAGSGKEENRANTYREKAGFAQPSGIVYLSHCLYVADSESSTIKEVSLMTGQVKIIVGGGLDPTDLFAFGDCDGKGREAKLQHPLGLCAINLKNLIIADTYNHKIKVVDIEEQTCKSLKKFYGMFNEPGDLCLVHDMLVVCDTNHHRLRKILVKEIYDEITPKIFTYEATINNLYPEEELEHSTFALSEEVYCSFIIDCAVFSVSEGFQKLDVLFEGEKLEVIIVTEKYFNKSVQPSIILRPIKMDCTYSIPTKVTLNFILPLCDKTNNVCLSKNVIFKFLVYVQDQFPKKMHLKCKIDESKLCD